jgi:hypothetical protein
VIWFVVSDALFERPMGEALVRGLIATFVW